MKRYLIVVVTIIMVAALFSACKGGSQPDQTQGSSTQENTTQEESNNPEPAQKYTIGISYQGPNNDWAINFLAHFNMTLEKYADQVEKVIYKEYGWDEAQQIADVEDLMLMDIDLLIIAPNSDTGLATSIENVKAAGIPVVVYNAHPGTDQYDALIMSDNAADGAVLAEWLAKRLDGKGNVIIMEGAPGSNYAENTVKGYTGVLDGYPDMEIIGIEYAYWTPATAKEIIESYIAKGDKIDGILVQGLMGLGCLEAFLDAGIDVPPMTAGDGWTGFLRRAKEVGYTDFAAIPVNNFEYAVGAINLAFSILNGESVPKDTIVPPNAEMPAQTMLDMVTPDMPESFWIGGFIPVEDFNKYCN